jgi:hypothetical protein
VSGRALRAAFVRTAGEPDRIYVTRSDGSETAWSFPSYGDGLPHDLVHLVVESAFGLGDGFWGRVDGGADPRRINAEANRRGGKDKYAAFGPEPSELRLAEALAGTPWHLGSAREEARASCERLGLAAPDGLTEERVSETRAFLALLEERWRALTPKGALHVVFRRDRPRAGFEELSRELGDGGPAGGPAGR